MKKTILVLFILTMSSLSAIAQTVNCQDLMTYVKRNGREKATVSSLQLLNSTWLKEVKAYEIENTIVVIASIKKMNIPFLQKIMYFVGYLLEIGIVFTMAGLTLAKLMGRSFTYILLIIPATATNHDKSNCKSIQ